MANVTNSNTIYIDATGDLSIGTDTNIRVFYVVMTATAGNAVLELEDNQASTVDKLYLGVATSGETKVFDFSRKPIVFPNGIEVTTATNVKATLVIDRSA